MFDKFVGVFFSSSCLDAFGDDASDGTFIDCPLGICYPILFICTVLSLGASDTSDIFLDYGFDLVLLVSIISSSGYKTTSGIPAYIFLSYNQF